jgi:hypothetical protein
MPIIQSKSGFTGTNKPDEADRTLTEIEDFQSD